MFRSKDGGRSWTRHAQGFPRAQGWLTAIDADTSHGPLSVKVSADRPHSITDGCILDNGTLVHEKLSYTGSGQCATAFPVASNTRLTAGESLAMPVLKCALQPLRFNDYPVTFTAAEKTELRAAFPGAAIRMATARA